MQILKENLMENLATEVLNVKSKASIHGEVTTGKFICEPGADS
jgi:hypothetical protein